jgi:hypothetical protein
VANAFFIFEYTEADVVEPLLNMCWRERGSKAVGRTPIMLSEGM